MICTSSHDLWGQQHALAGRGISFSPSESEGKIFVADAPWHVLISCMAVFWFYVDIDGGEDKDKNTIWEQYREQRQLTPANNYSI